MKRPNPYEVGKGPFVVKAQISQFSSDGEQRVLVYDASRTVEWEGVADPETAKLIGPRSFWWAFLMPDGKIDINTKAKSSEDEFDKYDYPTMVESK